MDVVVSIFTILGIVLNSAGAIIIAKNDFLSEKRIVENLSASITIR